VPAAGERPGLSSFTTQIKEKTMQTNATTVARRRTSGRDEFGPIRGRRMLPKPAAHARRPRTENLLGRGMSVRSTLAYELA
jgi:hypothetical protein